MDKELKIAVTVFLIFLIFGFASYVNLGSFVTPIFINQFVFVLISVIFFGMNFKEKNASILAIYVLITFFGLFVDEFSMGYLAQKYENNVFLDFSRSTAFSIGFLIVYFGFFLFLTYYLYKNTKKTWLFGLNIILICTTVISLFLNDLPNMSSLIFSIFLVSFILGVNKLLTRDDKVLSVLSYQFLLLLVLEGLEYLQ